MTCTIWDPRPIGAISYFGLANTLVRGPVCSGPIGISEINASVSYFWFANTLAVGPVHSGYGISDLQGDQQVLLASSGLQAHWWQDLFCSGPIGISNLLDLHAGPEINDSVCYLWLASTLVAGPVLFATHWHFWFALFWNPGPSQFANIVCTARPIHTGPVLFF